MRTLPLQAQRQGGVDAACRRRGNHPKQRGVAPRATDPGSDEARSAVERALGGDRGEKIERALREAAEASAAREALSAKEADKSFAESRRRRRDESIAELEDRVAEVEAAGTALRRARSAKAELGALLDRDRERLASAQAGAAGAAASALATLPLALTGASDVLDVAAALASGALFGVTYRYAVRGGDAAAGASDPLQLRGGVVLAFALTRTLGAALGPGGSTDGLTARLASLLRPEVFIAGFGSAIAFAAAAAAVDAVANANASGGD